MRVLVLSQYYPPDMGGGASRAANVVQGLVRASCDVIVISAVPHYPTGKIEQSYRWKPICIETENGVKVIRSFVPPLASEGFFKRAILFISFVISSLFALPLVGKIDAIWVANPNVTASYSAIIYKTLKRVPILQNVDDLWPESLYDIGVDSNSLISRIGVIMASISYRIASALTPVSPGYIRTLVHKYRIPPEKVNVIRAGVNTITFTPREKESRLRKFRVLYIGALSPAYNFMQIIEAAKKLEHDHEIEFIIRGGGEMSSLIRKLISSNNASNVSFIQEIVSREEVARELQNADILLLPLSKGSGSIELGISSKLYEYQATGKPILCCSSGYPGRHVKETQSGIVVEPGDIGAIVRSIITLKENNELASQMGRNGRKWVEENSSLSAIGLQMRTLILSIIRSN